jgi:universal stress protein A
MKKRATLSERVTRRLRPGKGEGRSATEPRKSPALVPLVPAHIQIKSILAPVDFSNQSMKAVHYALSFAEQYGARIILLNVVEPAVYPSELGYIPSEIEALHENVMTGARERLQSLVRDQLPRGIPVEQQIRVGSPYLEITAAARELDVDLIVVATHGYTGLKHVFLGSTAERVIRHASCPVLTVREREHDFV